MVSPPGMSCGISCQSKVWLPTPCLPRLHTCADGNGLISRDEVLQTPGVMGLPPWVNLLAPPCLVLRAGGSGVMSRNELWRKLPYLSTIAFPLPAPATCADGNGLISRDELLQTLSKQGVTVQGIDDIIAEVDKDGNGHIDYFEVQRRSVVQDFSMQGELGQRCQQAAFFSELLPLCGLDRRPRDCNNCKYHWWPARRQVDPHPAAPLVVHVQFCEMLHEL